MLLPLILVLSGRLVFYFRRQAATKCRLPTNRKSFDERRAVIRFTVTALQQIMHPHKVASVPRLPLVTTEALGDLHTDSAWPIGNFGSRLSTALAVDNQITVLIENILNKQCQIQVHIVISKVGPAIKD